MRKRQGRPENKKLRLQIKTLILEGKSYSQIQEVTNCSRHTISKVNKQIKLENNNVGINDNVEEINILNTKLYKPTIPSSFVYREHIIQKLNNQINNPISLIIAPSGYGKSTAISQWLETNNLDFAWLSLDVEHNNLRIFLTYLSIAMHKVQSNSLNQIKLLTQATELPSVKTIANVLINELDRIENDFVLVIDDFQQINNPEIYFIFNAILKFPPENMHLCLISRKLPLLDFHRLKLHNRLVEIGINELSFSNSEILTLFKKQGIFLPEKKTAQLIKEKTEGWVVGIKLLMIKENTDKQSNIFSNFHLLETSSNLDTLSNEFLRNIPNNLLEVLLLASVLDRFCDDLLNNIISNNQLITNREFIVNKESIIDEILAFNLFLIPLDNECKWYRFHHLFKEVLYERLSIEKPGSASIIHKKAITWFVNNKLYEDAIKHALIIKDEETAAEIVEKNCVPLIEKDKWYIVELWLNQLTETIIYKRPALTIARMWVYFQQSRIEDLYKLLLFLETLYKNNKLDAKSKGEFAFFYGFVMYFFGEKKKSIAYLKKAYEILKHIKGLVLGEVEIMYALALQMNGEKCGISFLEKNILNQKTPNHLYLTRQYAGLGFVHLLYLDLPKAMIAINKLEKVNLRAESLYVNSWKDFSKGVCFYNGLKSEKAINAFQKSVNNRYISDMIISINAYKGLILSYLQCNDYNNAKLKLQELIDFTEEKEDPVNTAMVQSIKARFNLITGKNKEALIWALSYTEPIEPVSSFIWVESPHITQICILLKEGNEEHLERAESILNSLEHSARDLNLDSQLVEVLNLKSILRYRQDKNDEAIALINQAYELARKGGYLRPFAENKIYINSYTLSFDTSNKLDTINELLYKIPNNYYSPEINNSTSEDDISKKDIGGFDLISIREKEVLELVLIGYRNKEIAHKLHISINTVKKHVYNTFKKFNVGNRIELLKIAKNLEL